MFSQFALPLGAGSMLSSGVKAEPGLETLDLADLLVGPEGLPTGFSGELQTLLSQLSPQLIQRLQTLVAGGMTLPQAASTVLGEGGMGGTDDLFAHLLQRGMNGNPDDAELSLPTLRTPDTPAPQQWARVADQLGMRLAEGEDWTQLLQLQSQTGAHIGPGQPLLTGGAAVVQTLPPQLATNLLHMGVPQAVTAKGWDQAIAERVMWMVQGDQQFARLRLNPPNLGPLEIRINVNQEQTSVNFIAGQAVVREAIEAAMPRLREMFDQQSLQLVRADVSDPGTQSGGRSGDSGDREDAGRGIGYGASGDEPALSAVQSEPLVLRSSSLVDLFV